MATINKIPYSKGEATLNKLIAEQTKCVMLFTGEPKQDGTNWCPDCEVITPLYPEFEKECADNKLPFYVFIAGDRDTWKDPQNFFRQHKAIHINNVPTMGLFDGKKLTASRLSGDNEIGKKQQRAMIFEE